MKQLFTLFFSVSAIVLSAQSYNSPESIEFDYVNNRWFVANHGAGEILIRNSATGAVTLFASGFATGPHGLEIVNDTIYACDGSNLRAYNIYSGALIFNMNLGATFLNGITHDNSGNLYITDFTAKKIFRFNTSARQYNVYVSGLAKSPNGIIFDQPNNRCVFVNWGSAAPIMAVSLVDSTISTCTTTSLSNCDGITKDGSGNYYVSSWGANAIHKFNNTFSGGPITVVSGLSSPADIFYNTVSDTLGVPNSGSTGVNANKPTFHYFGSTTGFTESIKKSDLRIFPDPAQESVIIEYSCDDAVKSSISLFDIDGRLLRSIAERPALQGMDRVEFSCEGLSPGIYFVKVKSGDRVRFQKFSVLQ